MSRSLDGQVAVITGAASGIGKEIAFTLARAGAAVAIADLDLDGAQQVAARIVAEGGRALGVAMDVSDEAAVNAGSAQVEQALGPVEILIANAGIQIVAPIHEFAFADWKKLLAIHLDGAFLATRAVLPGMYARGRGTVIYMGSAHSHEASPLKSAYVTAKHGLLGLARTLAREGGPHGVRSHVVCPGFVRTPLVEKQIPEQAASLGISEDEVVKRVMLGNTVDGTFTTLEDVATTVRFLCEFPSNALTGQSILVSHGWHMG
jgi:3-hydroxybutyrate dehydrogenase